MNEPDTDGVDPTELLAWAAATHEADRARVIARLGFDPAIEEDAGRRGHSTPRRLPVRRRVSTVPAGMAAAAAAVVLAGVSVVGVAVVAHRPPTTASDGPPIVTANSATQPLPTPPPSHDRDGPTDAPATSAPAGSTVTTSPSGRPPTPDGGGSPGPGGPVTAVVRPVASGTAVDLTAGTDWVALTRSDGKQVRSATTVRATPTVHWSGASAGRPSPWSVSWTGGAPEQEHARATTWLALGSGGSVTVTVPALSAPATLTLYLGAAGADVAVSGVASAAWSPPGADPAAAAVTVPIPASAHASQVVITANGASSAGIVGLAAVALD